jgi:hypothetical protein
VLPVYSGHRATRRYGAARVNAACTTALPADLVDVTRLKRMLELAFAPATPSAFSARQS